MNPITPKDLKVWSQLLCEHALKCNPTDKLFIYAECQSLPLVKACIEYCTKNSIHIEYSLYDLQASYITLQSDDTAFLTTQKEQLASTIGHFNKYLFIYAQSTLPLEGIFAEKSTIALKSQEKMHRMILQEKAKGTLDWCRTDYPTEEAAKASGFSLDEYWSSIRKMSYLETEDPLKAWQMQHTFNQALIDYLKDKKSLHIFNSEGTDLEIDIDGMGWGNLSATINFPDGEILSAPKPNGKNGGIEGSFVSSFKTLYKNIPFEKVELQFKNGVLSEFKTDQNAGLFEKLVNTDEGARRVGEVAIGTNFELDRGLCNILYDEKIGGTFHLALGKAYPETGNTNQSALHWDLITDMRKDAWMKADGKLFFKDGAFVEPSITRLYNNKDFCLFRSKPETD